MRPLLTAIPRRPKNDISAASVRLKELNGEVPRVILGDTALVEAEHRDTGEDDDKPLLSASTWFIKQQCKLPSPMYIHKRRQGSPSARDLLRRSAAIRLLVRLEVRLAAVLGETCLHRGLRRLKVGS